MNPTVQTHDAGAAQPAADAAEAAAAAAELARLIAHAPPGSDARVAELLDARPELAALQLDACMNAVVCHSVDAISTAPGVRDEYARRVDILYRVARRTFSAVKLTTFVTNSDAELAMALAGFRCHHAMWCVAARELDAGRTAIFRLFGGIERRDDFAGKLRANAAEELLERRRTVLSSVATWDAQHKRHAARASAALDECYAAQRELCAALATSKLKPGDLPAMLAVAETSRRAWAAQKAHAEAASDMFHAAAANAGLRVVFHRIERVLDLPADERARMAAATARALEAPRGALLAYAAADPRTTPRALHAALRVSDPADPADPADLVAEAREIGATRVLDALPRARATLLSLTRCGRRPGGVALPPDAVRAVCVRVLLFE